MTRTLNMPEKQDFRLKEHRDEIYHRLTDLKNVRHLVQLSAGDVVYSVQCSTDGAFPRGLYRTNVLTRFAKERNGVFAPAPVINKLFGEQPLEIIDLRTPSVSPVEEMEVHPSRPVAYFFAINFANFFLLGWIFRRRQ